MLDTVPVECAVARFSLVSMVCILALLVSSEYKRLLVNYPLEFERVAAVAAWHKGRVSGVGASRRANKLCWEGAVTGLTDPGEMRDNSGPPLPGDRLHSF